MKNQQNRALGAFEKTFWLLDQIDSKDFLLAGEIEGTHPVEVWRDALNKIQERHPNLSVKITLDESLRPFLEHADGISIPLRVLTVEDEYRWEDEAEKELATRFDTAKGPLLRAVLLQKPSSTVLILSGHHAIADGTSIMYLFRDILKAVSGQQLEAMEAQPSNDNTLGLPDDQITNGERVNLPHIAFKQVAPKVESIRLDADATQSIIDAASTENTTVHGAICAAVLIASTKLNTAWVDEKIEMITPICSRRALQLDDNYGLNITTHAVYFEGEQQLSFWDVARLAKAGLAGTDTAEHVNNYINFFRDIVFNSSDLQKMVDILKNAFNHHIMVTNLGRVKYDANFGNLKLKSLYGPIVRSGKGKEQTVGVVTTNGVLALTNTSDNPIAGLLQEVVEILTVASQVEAATE